MTGINEPPFTKQDIDISHRMLDLQMIVCIDEKLRPGGWLAIYLAL